tara:strand:- start:5450 stop:5650 length:201 start_codon:yes stop_codon:yes gene_type:complete
MNNIGAAMLWLKANPDMIILIGVVFLVVATVIDAKLRNKSVLYMIGSVAALTAAGVLFGVFLVYLK